MANMYNMILLHKTQRVIRVRRDYSTIATHEAACVLAPWEIFAGAYVSVSR